MIVIQVNVVFHLCLHVFHLCSLELEFLPPENFYLIWFQENDDLVLAD